MHVYWSPYMMYDVHVHMQIHFYVYVYFYLIPILVPVTYLHSYIPTHILHTAYITWYRIHGRCTFKLYTHMYQIDV